jgi:hypothetical protein
LGVNRFLLSNKTAIFGNPQRVRLHVDIDAKEKCTASSFRVAELRREWRQSDEVEEVVQSYSCVVGNVGEEIELAPDRAEV